MGAVGYRIQYAGAGGILRAVVSGRSSAAHAPWIAHDIAEQASRQSARRVLIDVRGLDDRVGTLGVLVRGPARVVHKVAVVDSPEHDRYHVFAELAARRSRSAVRCFETAAAAMRWLNGSSD